MSTWSTRPGVNDSYANYLVGLGMGVILGAMFGYSSSTFPKFLMGSGVVFVVVGVAISIRILKDGKK